MEQDAFKRYENLNPSYHKDSRWKEVDNLRRCGRNSEANHIVLQIREDYGFNQ